MIAGVALMALGTLADNPDCGLKIVPCGMNYFHAHKFRSRAVIEFGNPIEVPKELVEQFKQGERRESVGALLDIIYQSLVAVTVTSPDYETLMVGPLSDDSSLFHVRAAVLIHHRSFKLLAACTTLGERNFPCRWLWSLTAVS